MKIVIDVLIAESIIIKSICALGYFTEKLSDQGMLYVKK